MKAATKLADHDNLFSINQSFQVAMPAKESGFMIRDKDWDRIERRLNSAKHHRKEFFGAAWTFVGVLAGAILGAVAWAPAHRAMPADMQPEFAWVWPVFIATAVASLILAVGAFWAARLTEGTEAASIDEILEDMAEIRRNTESGG